MTLKSPKVKKAIPKSKSNKDGKRSRKIKQPRKRRPKNLLSKKQRKR